MNYEAAHKKIVDAGAKWDDFIAYMQDKPYNIDPDTHYILYPIKTITRFLKQHERAKRV